MRRLATSQNYVLMAPSKQQVCVCVCVCVHVCVYACMYVCYARTYMCVSCSSRLQPSQQWKPCPSSWSLRAECNVSTPNHITAFVYSTLQSLNP